MKGSICTGLFAVGVVLIALASLAGAQGSGPPSPAGPQAVVGTAFTYQGELRTASGLVSGTCNFQFSLWDALSDGAQVGSAQAVNGVSVVQGRFVVQLDFGSNAFGGDARWLQIAVQCGGDTGLTTLAPRQPLTPAPYALYSPRSSWSGLGGVPAGFADNVDNDTIYAAGAGLNLAGNQFNVNTATIQARVSGPCGAGYAIRVVNVDGSVTCEPTSSGSAYWSLTGNAGTDPDVNFLGTTDAVSLTLRVGNAAALRLQPGAGTPNIVGGYAGNVISTAVRGGVIAGGGSALYVNRVTADYATIGGGRGNTASGQQATVAGGMTNLASGEYATVGGGHSHTASGSSSTIGGGSVNTATLSCSTVGGGYRNTASAIFATVGGGTTNVAEGYGATVGGGGSNIASGWGAAIGGGTGNVASDDDAVVGGGAVNKARGAYSTVSGGYSNTVSGPYAAICGGNNNVVTATYAFIGGGVTNTVISEYAVIGGGSINRASGDYAVVGGGYSNTVTGMYATVSGGGRNIASDAQAVVGGGEHNIASGYSSVVAGGEDNIASAYKATVGGGSHNIASGAYATVPGGVYNIASGGVSFAAGYHAQAVHAGTFVWGDYHTDPIASTKENQFVIRASNGVSLSVDAGNTTVIEIGERYRDNAIVAWAKIQAGGTVAGTADFGVTSVQHVNGTGVYTITLDVSAFGANHLIPIATAEVDSPPVGAANVRIVSINQIAVNQLVVYINNGNWALVDNDFVFMVTAR